METAITTDLCKLIDQAKLVVKEFEESLGWDEDICSDDNKQLVECSINKNHYLHQERYKLWFLSWPINPMMLRSMFLGRLVTLNFAHKQSWKLKLDWSSW